MVNWFGTHYNQEVRFSSAVERRRGPQVLTSLCNEQVSYLASVAAKEPGLALVCSTLFISVVFSTGTILIFPLEAFFTELMAGSSIGFLEPISRSFSLCLFTLSWSLSWLISCFVFPRYISGKFCLLWSGSFKGGFVSVRIC